MAYLQGRARTFLFVTILLPFSNLAIQFFAWLHQQCSLGDRQRGKHGKKYAYQKSYFNLILGWMGKGQIAHSIVWRFPPPLASTGVFFCWQHYWYPIFNLSVFIWNPVRTLALILLLTVFIILTHYASDIMLTIWLCSPVGSRGEYLAISHFQVIFLFTSQLINCSTHVKILF